MRFCSLKFQNLVRKIDLVNRRWMVYSRAYGNRDSFYWRDLFLVLGGTGGCWVVLRGIRGYWIVLDGTG